MKIVSDLIHPNILRFYSVKDYSPQLPFVVFTTEWCEGGDLLKKIKKLQLTGVKGMTEPDMKATFRQLCESLLWLDQRNICHRDLKVSDTRRVRDRNRTSVQTFVHNIRFSARTSCSTST